MAKKLTSVIFRGEIKDGVLTYNESYARSIIKGYGDCSIRITIEEVSPKRTPRQNRSLYKWLTWLAEVLNNAGLDQKKVLKPEIDIPWTQEAAKIHLWHPIQKAMFDIESTASMTKPQVGEVEKVLTRHLSQKFAVEIPEWPHYKTEEEYIEATTRTD
jgi:hypothetical protein